MGNRKLYRSNNSISGNFSQFLQIKFVIFRVYCFKLMHEQGDNLGWLGCCYIVSLRKLCQLCRALLGETGTTLITFFLCLCVLHATSDGFFDQVRIANIYQNAKWSHLSPTRMISKLLIKSRPCCVLNQFLIHKILRGHGILIQNRKIICF